MHRACLCAGLEVDRSSHSKGERRRRTAEPPEAAAAGPSSIRSAVGVDAAASEQH